MFFNLGDRVKKLTLDDWSYLRLELIFIVPWLFEPLKFYCTYFQAVGHWAATLNSTSLLDTAAKLVDRALSCGYTGLVMLHGMLSRSQLTSWQPHLYGNYHPSYYGMMAASFLFAECDQILA